MVYCPWQGGQTLLTLIAWLLRGAHLIISPDADNELMVGLPGSCCQYGPHSLIQPFGTQERLSSPEEVITCKSAGVLGWLPSVSTHRRLGRIAWTRCRRDCRSRPGAVDGFMTMAVHLSVVGFVYLGMARFFHGSYRLFSYQPFAGETQGGC